jgi:hypothetical protein
MFDLREDGDTRDRRETDAMQSGLIAFFLSTIIAGAAWAWADHKWVGALVGIAGVVGLVGTLLKGSSQRSVTRDRERKLKRND